MAKQYSRKNKNKTSNPKKEKNIIASATITENTDTNILQEDLYREFFKDKSDTDIGLLVDQKWVRFFDPSSSFLKGMMALCANSTTNRNIINQKTTLTIGDGFIPVSAKKVPFLQNLRKLFKLQTAQENAIEEINDLIGNVNLNNETLEEVIEKVAFDWWAFGNAIVEFKKTVRDNKEVIFIYHIPLEQVGIHKANNNNVVESIGVTANWAIDGENPSNVTEIPLYPKFDSSGRSAIHIKNYAPGFFYWGLPENIASRFWQEIEYYIPKFNIGKFKNGFKLSAIIQAYGSFTKEEADELVDSFHDFYTGTGKNDGLLVQVLRDKAAKADITLLNDKTDGDFVELQKLATQAIITANRWTPSLSGISLSGKLGSNQQMRDELDFVNNTTIKQGRRKIMQSIVNPFIKENAKLNKKIDGVLLHVLNSNPISLASTLNPDSILTRDEKREIYGYNALGGDEGESIEGNAESNSESNQTQSE